MTGHPAIAKSFSTLIAAETWWVQTRAAMLGDTLIRPSKMTFAMLLDAGLPRLNKPVTAIFQYWRQELGPLMLDRITADLIAQHRDRLLAAECCGHNNTTTKQRSTACVRNYLIELSRLFTLAVRELRVVTSNPCATVRRPKASMEVVRYLLDSERVVLLAACRASESLCLYLFVLFCLTTGCRKGEASALEWNNVDLVRRWAVFPKTKNGSSRGVPLTDAVCALLAARSRTGPRVFAVDIAKAWRTAIRRSGVVDFRFHDLRHSCASTLVQSGSGLAQIAKLLGHQSLQMTMRYAHLGGADTTAMVDRVMGGIA